MANEVKPQYSRLSKTVSFLKKVIISLVVLILLIWIFVVNYDFVFKTRVAGEVQGIEKVGVQAVVTQGVQPINPQVFSFSVAIKDLKTNEIHMASSEDRQWGAVQKGNCVIAAYFPYAPWMFYKGSTHHRARLLKNYVSCADLPQDNGFIENLRFFFLLY